MLVKNCVLLICQIAQIFDSCLTAGIWKFKKLTVLLLPLSFLVEFSSSSSGRVVHFLSKISLGGKGFFKPAFFEGSTSTRGLAGLANLGSSRSQSEGGGL